VIYNVAWLETAIRELDGELLMADPPTRAAVARAVPRMNDRLAIAPLTQGETRPSNNVRIAFELPLRVFYRVEPAGNLVTVLRAEIVRKPRRP
jgi:hypothetical protein